jgi:two-component system chemotaxis response regulator CheB
VRRKPAAALARGIAQLRSDLETVLRKAHQEDRLHPRPRPDAVDGVPLVRSSPGQVIAIGASTGGTEALAELLAHLPASVPGVLLVQHMPALFTRRFAERLDEASDLEVKEAVDGDEVRPGRALLAPGGRHMTLQPHGDGYRVRVERGEKVNGHCPSVDVLMRSVARHAGPRAIGVLLTGMGRDGADGMKSIREAGGGTIAQDEATSLVYGMPKEAVRCGGAARVVPLPDIPRHVLDLLGR